MNINTIIESGNIKIQQGSLFPGLSENAINYLIDHGDWDEQPEGFNIEGNTEAFMYIVDPETQSVGFVILYNNCTLFGVPNKIVKHHSTGKPSFMLREYDLNDGTKAIESVQGSICNYTLFSLSIGDEYVIEWTQEEIEEIGKECGETQLKEIIYG